MEQLIIILGILTLCIIALVFLTVWRDRRELKLNQITKEISRFEESLKEIYQIKEEIEKMLTAARKHTDLAVSQVEGQVKQVRNSVAHLEQRLHVVSSSAEKRNISKEREKNQRPQGKGKPRGNGRELKQKDQTPSKSGKEEFVKINDGEKYAKLYELADRGLSPQEIAQQLNLGYDEVELVLGLKGKRLS
ncbi:MAG: hypothetical protein QHH75_02695 [Bacillota bacterium]|nr:hypothetical protein [Bacillota bacterium]